MANNPGFPGFLLRWILAFALVAGTYNPTQYSFVQWVRQSEGITPVIAMVGILLLIAWIFFLRTTVLALGWLGIILGAALFACMVWFSIDQGWLRLDDSSSMTWVVLVILSLLLATGMSWSFFRRRMSGQVITDDVEDN